MSRQLVALNPDLLRLREAGYNVDIVGGYLLLRNIPYVTATKEIRRGILASALDLAGDKTIRPSDHTAKFVGEYPCYANGSPINQIRHEIPATPLSGELVAQHSFSSKPAVGYYSDYYEKMNTYASIISSQAAALDPSQTAWTLQVVQPEDEDSPFNYLDTASSRADIDSATRKLKVEKVAIVGLGGTGSYVLDLLAKTPVKQIHLFDGDKFSTHNAFRCPGAPSIEELREQPTKVAYLKDRYSKMHRGIVPHETFVNAANAEQLREMAFVFLCIDGGPAKKSVVEKLEAFGIPFIDVGMGLYLAGDSIGGILRVTTSMPEKRQVARARMSLHGDEKNEYDKNIQIADLNALNAALAVMKWKKLRGFYLDQESELFSSYTVGCNMLLSEDTHEKS